MRRIIFLLVLIGGIGGFVALYVPIIVFIARTCFVLMYVSCGILGWVYLVRRNLELHPLFNVGVLNNYFFGIFALFALLFLFEPGFERALFFVPEGWGSYDEDGEWFTHRGRVAFHLSFIAGGLVLAAFFDSHKRRLLGRNVPEKLKHPSQPLKENTHNRKQFCSHQLEELASTSLWKAVESARNLTEVRQLREAIQEIESHQKRDSLMKSLRRRAREMNRGGTANNENHSLR